MPEVLMFSLYKILWCDIIYILKLLFTYSKWIYVNVLFYCGWKIYPIMLGFLKYFPTGGSFIRFKQLDVVWLLLGHLNIFKVQLQ